MKKTQKQLENQMFDFIFNSIRSRTYPEYHSKWAAIVIPSKMKIRDFSYKILDFLEEKDNFCEWQIEDCHTKKYNGTVYTMTIVNLDNDEEHIIICHPKYFETRYTTDDGDALSDMWEANFYCKPIIYWDNEGL